MTDWQQHPIYRCSDGSYIILQDNEYCHIYNKDDTAQLWADIHAYAQEHPDQAEEVPEPVSLESSLEPEETDWQQHPIFTREDGSYVITRNNYPYHVPNEGEFTELWAKVHAYAQEHPNQMEPEPGPPEPGLKEIQEQSLEQIHHAYDKALTATLSLTSGETSATALAMEASLFAVEDPEGLSWLLAHFQQHKAALEERVRTITSKEELARLDIHFPI